MRIYILGYKHKVLTFDTMNIVGVYTNKVEIITKIKKLKQKIERRGGFLNDLVIREYFGDLLISETDWSDFIKKEYSN